MPRRKRPQPSKEAVEAIKESLKAGTPLSQEQEAEFQEFRKRVRLLERPEGEVVVKEEWDGTLRFREKGKSGVGTHQHPAWISNAEREREFLTELAKITRRPPKEKAIAARQAKSEVLVQKLEDLLKAYGHLGRGAAKAVAAELGISPEYVRRVRARPKQT